MQAADTDGKSSQCTVRINVTDKNQNIPHFVDAEYTFRVSEDKSKGVVIGKVQVSLSEAILNFKIIELN